MSYVDGFPLPSSLFLFFQDPLNLSLQLRFEGEQCLVLGHQQVIRDSSKSQSYRRIILFRSQDNAYRRIFQITILLFGKVIQVHIHLAHVSRIGLPGLQVDEYEAVEEVMVKNKIYVVWCPSNRDSALPTDKGVALAKFQHKILEVSDEAFF